MKSEQPSMNKHASQKTSGQCFSGNQGGNSNIPTPMELGHLKPQKNLEEVYHRYVSAIVIKWIIILRIVYSRKRIRLVTLMLQEVPQRVWKSLSKKTGQAFI